MPNDYSEDKLMEQTCIEIFQSLKYDFVNCYEEKFGKSTLGRESLYRITIVASANLFDQIEEYSLIKRLGEIVGKSFCQKIPFVGCRSITG